jgi:hypothetical protein
MALATGGKEPAASAVAQRWSAGLPAAGTIAQRWSAVPLTGSHVISTGITALDRLLPAGGLRRGTLVEWLAAGRGGGAGSRAIVAAAQAAAAGGVAVTVDRARRFYAPAAVALGLDPQRPVLLRPRTTVDEMWALDQVLRTAGVAAGVWWGGALSGIHYRRLQLAVQRSGALGLLVRPAAMRAVPSWADVRLLAEARCIPGAGGRRLRIEVVRCRAGAGGGSVEVEIDDETGAAKETHPPGPAAELARAAPARRAARA